MLMLMLVPLVPGSIKERSGLRKGSVRQQQQGGRINTFDPVPAVSYFLAVDYDCAEFRLIVEIIILRELLEISKPNESVFRLF
jgi:hypothetical protein